MDISNSSFIYPNRQPLILLNKTIDDIKISFTITKTKAQLVDIFKIFTTVNDWVKNDKIKHEEPLLLYKNPLRLNNYGNNCYINSSIQALLPTINIDLKASLRSARQYKFPAIELFNLYIDKLETKSEFWSPISNIRDLKYFSKNFRNGAQEDAQEFLNGFLDRLREEFDKIDKFKAINNPIRKAYTPFYDCRYYCCKCKKSNIKSPQIQEELTFFLELAQDLPGMINQALKTQNNNFKCENCKTTNGSARMDAVFTSLPKSFICCIKRFKHSFFSSSKNGRDVDFCKHIQLPYLDSAGNRKNATYDIAAVVIHLGNSLSSGHYECITKLDGQWHRISDSSIMKINEFQAITTTKNSSYIYIFTETSRNCPLKSDLKKKHLSEICSENNHNSMKSSNNLKRKLSDKPFYTANYQKNNNSFKRHKPDFKSSKSSYGMKQIMAVHRQKHNNNFSSSNNKSFKNVNSSPLKCNSNPVLCQNS